MKTLIFNKTLKTLLSLLLILSGVYITVADDTQSGSSVVPYNDYLPPENEFGLGQYDGEVTQWAADDKGENSPVPQDASIYTNIGNDGNIEPQGAMTNTLPPAKENFFYFNSPSTGNTAGDDYDFIMQKFIPVLDRMGISYVFLFNKSATNENITNYLSSPNLEFAVLAGDGAENQCSINSASGQYSAYDVLGLPTPTDPYGITKPKVTIDNKAAIMINDCWGFSDLGLALIQSGATQVFGSFQRDNGTASITYALVTSIIYMQAMKNNINCSLTDAFKYMNYLYITNQCC